MKQQKKLVLNKNTIATLTDLSAIMAGGTISGTYENSECVDCPATMWSCYAQGCYVDDTPPPPGPPNFNLTQEEGDD